MMRYLSPMGKRESSFSVEREDGRGDGAEGEYNPLYGKKPCIDFVVLVCNSLRLCFIRVRCGFSAAIELKQNQKYQSLCSFCA